MGDTNYYHVRWSAHAELDGQRIDISFLQAVYMLDAIPTITFSPVVGVNASSGEDAGGVEQLLNAAPFTPIKVYIKGETDEDGPQGSGTPGFKYNTDVLIFDGYFTGVTYQSLRSAIGGTVTVRAEAASWLVGLLGTTVHNQYTAIKGPGGFAEIASVGNEANPTLAPCNISNVFVAGADQAVADLWREFIKPLFNAITEVESVWGSEDNTSAIDALDKMDNDAGFPGDSADITLSFGSLAPAVSKETFGEWLGSSVAKHLFYAWKCGSLWEALISLSKEFRFRIVPLIETATCAPVFGALGGDAYIVVGADEYHDITMAMQTPEMITKIVVVSSGSAITHPFSGKPITSAVVGEASAKEAFAGPLLEVAGKAVKIQAPTWLVNEPAIGRFTKISLGKDKMAIPDASNPGAFTSTPSGDDDYIETLNTFLRTEAGDAFAKTVMYDTLLASRVGGLAGRFRLDIAPGSTIAVEVIGGKFSQGATDQYIYGLVQGVTLEMNAGDSGGSGRAVTVLGLSYVRTGQEHTGYGGYMTEDEHPLYKTAYRGTKLWIEG